MVRLLNADPSLDFIYSDEDKIDADGRRILPFFKPGWSPDFLLSVNYICHFAVLRHSIVKELGVSAAVMTVHRIMIFSCG